MISGIPFQSSTHAAHETGHPLPPPRLSRACRRRAFGRDGGVAGPLRAARAFFAGILKQVLEHGSMLEYICSREEQDGIRVGPGCFLCRAGAKKTPGNGRENCARNPGSHARAIRRANRAGAYRAPASAGGQARDTRGKGFRRRQAGRPAAERNGNGAERNAMEVRHAARRGAKTGAGGQGSAAGRALCLERHWNIHAAHGDHDRT